MNRRRKYGDINITDMSYEVSSSPDASVKVSIEGYVTTEDGFSRLVDCFDKRLDVYVAGADLTILDILNFNKMVTDNGIDSVLNYIIFKHIKNGSSYKYIKKNFKKYYKDNKNLLDNHFKENKWTV